MLFGLSGFELIEEAAVVVPDIENARKDLRRELVKLTGLEDGGR